MRDYVELKNCPFCGSDYVELDNDRGLDGSLFWFVTCAACGCRGSFKAEEERAVEAWNRRTLL